MGMMVLEGDLLLNSNKLTSLPDLFSNMKVGDELHLNDNQLETLPESFTAFAKTVGGCLLLEGNPLSDDLSVIKISDRVHSLADVHHKRVTVEDMMMGPSIRNKPTHVRPVNSSAGMGESSSDSDASPA